MKLPLLVPMHQQFNSTEIDNLEAELSNKLRASLLKNPPKKGGTVAIGVGSRGVSPIQRVVKTVIKTLKEEGLEPFIVPAMGSHGGGTAEGQRDVLLDYGITPDEVGAEIRATMDTVVLGETPEGTEVHIDSNAYDADHIIPIGRVKLHTGMSGDIQSGLCKILSIGLGKRSGAERVHEGGIETQVEAASRVMLASGKILCGVGLVENAYDRCAYVEVPTPENYIESDKSLLKKAKDLFPRIPTDHLHLLIVDEMGKNISGAGMDTNIIGKWRRIGGPKIPMYELITVLRLTDVSHGNASGIGNATFTTKQFVEQTNWHDTYVNGLTALVPDAVKTPVVLGSEQECIEKSIEIASRLSKNNPRIVRIKNTMELSEFWATENVAEELTAAGLATATGNPLPIPFDASGALAN